MKPDMNDISLLQKTLKNYFSWHGARIKFLALFIMAIFRVKSGFVAQIATAFSFNDQVTFNYNLHLHDKM